MANVWNIDSQWPKNHQLIVPSDTENLRQPMVVVANEEGTITVVNEFDVAILYNVTPGFVVPVRAKRVNATGTSAECIGVY